MFDSSMIKHLKSDSILNSIICNDVIFDLPMTRPPMGDFIDDFDPFSHQRWQCQSNLTWLQYELVTTSLAWFQLDITIVIRAKRRQDMCMAPSLPPVSSAPTFELRRITPSMAIISFFFFFWTILNCSSWEN